MRVLIVNSLYPPYGTGGAERSVSELAARLLSLGVTVAVATLTPQGSTEGRHEREDREGVTVHRWRPPGPWPFMPNGGELRFLQKTIWHARETYRPSARRFMRRVLAEFHPDVVHTNNIAGFGVSVLHDIRPRAWVHTYRDYYLTCPRTTRFKDGRPCGGGCGDCQTFVTARRLPADAPDAVVGVSGSVLDIHRQAGVWRSSPTSVLHNRPVVRRIARRRVDRIRTVGFLGRVDEAKGARVLLEAFSDGALSGLELVLAGPADAEALADAEVTCATRVRTIGVVPAEEFFSQVDLVVVPSQWDEPFGRVAAEAAVVGLPVLVSRRGGLPEAVGRAERAAVVDHADDPRAWSAAIHDATGRWRDFDVAGTTAASPTIDEPYLGVYEAALDRALHRIVGGRGT